MDLYVLGTVNTAMLKMKEDVPSVNVVCLQSRDFVVICPFSEDHYVSPCFCHHIIVHTCISFSYLY